MSYAATAERSATTLVVGLGNPILGDDGVGWRVADAVEARLARDRRMSDAIGRVELDRMSVGGLTLMERLIGYKRVVITDAAADGRPPGSIWAGDPAELVRRTAEHLDSAHDVTLQGAMDLAAALGADLPRDVHVVTVSVTGVGGEFSESLSPAVQRGVGPAAEAIVRILVDPGLRAP